MNEPVGVTGSIALEAWEEFALLDDQEEDEELSFALASQSLQIITFRLGTELYGIDILKVRELITYTQCAGIPNMPAFIKGMINLRGMVIPVLDLRLRFGIGTPSYDPYTVIIVVQVAGRLSGLIVDAVADVLAVAKEGVQPPPDHLTNIDCRFLAGVVKVREDMVILLDPDHLLAKEALAMAPESDGA